MAIYTGDQQSTATGVINGVVTAMSPAVVKANVASGATAYQFTAPYTLHWPPGTSSGPVSFRPGVGYSLDPALRTVLLALGAPMVAL